MVHRRTASAFNKLAPEGGVAGGDARVSDAGSVPRPRQCRIKRAIPPKNISGSCDVVFWPKRVVKGVNRLEKRDFGPRRAEMGEQAGQSN